MTKIKATKGEFVQMVNSLFSVKDLEGKDFVSTNPLYKAAASFLVILIVSIFLYNLLVNINIYPIL